MNQVSVEPTFERDPRRLHVLFGGHTIADSTGAVVLHRPGQLPVWYFPRQDVEMFVLNPTTRREVPDLGGQATYFTIYRDASVVENAAWSFEDPPPPLLAIAGLVAFEPAHFDLAIDGQTAAAWTAEHASTPDPIRPASTAFASVGDLAEALRRAAAAHDRHEARLGAADPDWPQWYASYLAAEQAGRALPV